MSTLKLIRRAEVSLDLIGNTISAETDLAKLVFIVANMRGFFPEGTELENGVATFPPATNVLDVMAKMQTDLLE